MLTDVLSAGGLQVPAIEGKAADELLAKLYPGSSVSNPIDFLATGTAEQLGEIIDFCDKKFDNIDAMAVIFGSPGLFANWEVYRVLHEKMRTAKKPIFPILPSIINVKDEIADFIANKKHINFPEECVFGNALCKIMNTPPPAEMLSSRADEIGIDRKTIRSIIEQAPAGYLNNSEIAALLTAAGVAHKAEIEVTTEKAAVAAAQKIGFPLAMKVVGVLHKSDVGGVALNIKDEAGVCAEFARLMQIPAATAVECAPMYSGIELFIGAQRDEKFGHQILFGLGGIFVEIFKDIQTVLLPTGEEELLYLIRKLRGHKIFEGIRGHSPVSEGAFVQTILRVAALLAAAPEIVEMDINPLIAKENSIVAVDARIRIEK